MKASLALAALSASTCALAAPIVMLLKHTPPASTITTGKLPPATVPYGTLPDGSRLRIPTTVTIVEDPEDEDVLEARPDNRPYRPSADVAPSVALSSPRPLDTSYLLSLDVTRKDHGAAHSPNETPNSSIMREEAGIVAVSHQTMAELEAQGNKPVYEWIPCKMHRGHYHVVRRYADMTVVSIVLVFIAVIALIELWEPMTRVIRRWRGHEGRIYLEDRPNEKALLRRRYTEFVLQPAPRPKAKLSPIPEKASEL